MVKKGVFLSSAMEKRGCNSLQRKDCWMIAKGDMPKGIEEASAC